MVENPYTSINLLPDTKVSLDAMRIYRRETWDDILQRLIKSYKENECVEEE